MNQEACTSIRPSRKRFSPEQINEVLERYQKSSLTQKQFAAEEGISVATLNNWLRRRRDASPLLSQGLLEVVAKDRAPRGRYRIEFPHGCCLVLEAGWQERPLRELLRILGSA